MVVTRSQAGGRSQPSDQARIDVDLLQVPSDSSQEEYLDDITYSIEFEHQDHTSSDDDDSPNDVLPRGTHVGCSTGGNVHDPPPQRGGDGLSSEALLESPFPSSTVPLSIRIPSVGSVGGLASTRQEPWGSVRPSFVDRKSTRLNSSH